MFEILDLTRPLDDNLPIYSEGAYADPPLQIETWCTIREQGYKVSRLSMGTQTGTHIDAPAHFVLDGATLETLPLGALIGPYLWLDIDRLTLDELDTLRSRPASESILFLTSSGRTNREISEEVFSTLLKLPCPVWAIGYDIQVAGREPLYFHKALAEAGKYLIEDLDETMALRVRAGGEMIALPLRLSGTSGSPCRVIVRQSLA